MLELAHEVARAPIVAARGDSERALADCGKPFRRIEQLGNAVRKAEAIQAGCRKQRRIVPPFSHAFEPRIEIAAQVFDYQVSAQREQASRRDEVLSKLVEQAVSNAMAAQQADKKGDKKRISYQYNNEGELVGGEVE